jgi:hypothetical protein
MRIRQRVFALAVSLSLALVACSAKGGVDKASNSGNGNRARVVRMSPFATSGICAATWSARS